MVGVGFGLLDVGVLCGEPAAANDDHELNTRIAHCNEYEKK